MIVANASTNITSAMNSQWDNMATLAVYVIDQGRTLKDILNATAMMLQDSSYTGLFSFRFWNCRDTNTY